MRQNKKKRISRAESLREGRVLARAGPDHETVVLQEHLRGGGGFMDRSRSLKARPPHIHARTNNPARHAERRIHFDIGSVEIREWMRLVHADTFVYAL